MKMMPFEAGERMSLLEHPAAPVDATLTRPSRYAYADNLKVLLVIGVIVAHATMAWTGVGTWVFDEPPVREPLLSALSVLELVGALFGLALFFLIAGAFTPRSLVRKGLRRFLVDRAVRLGVPMVFFILVLSPVVEYADPDVAGWTRGFPAFAVHTWWPPVPGPTWFLGVLLVFSAVYAVVRTVFPRRPATTPMRARHLWAAGMIVVVGSYLVRIAVPLGEERWHLAVGQAPAWIVGFTIGVVGAERGWFDRIPSTTSRRLCQVGWAAVAGTALVLGTANALGADLDPFGGGGTWQSLVVTVIEAALVVAMSLWLLDVFRRRFDRQGPLLGVLSRAAFAAFVVHQVVLVGLVLATRHVPWPPEVEYLGVAALGVAGSFALAWLLLRLPGVSRIV
jgi:hypothetical protein